MALTMARRAPAATVWAVDVNARARDLCAANAAANGLTNVRVAHPDDVDPLLRFAAIWSNPPIRVGKAAVHELLATWLHDHTPNVHPVGRNGMHRYNNQDHSMLTAMYSVENIFGADHDVWNVNVEQEYHEEKVAAPPHPNQ